MPEGVLVGVVDWDLADVSGLRRDAESFDHLADVGGARIERIVSWGSGTDWYLQDWDEFVLVHRGWADIELGDGSLLHLAEGGAAFLPAGLRHRVVRTAADGPTVWVAVHSR